MTEDQHFRRWDQWLDAIYADVQNLVIGHHVFEEVRKIVQANPRLQKPSSFYDLSAMTFAAWSAMAVRRQQDSKSISVTKLLSAIRRRPEVISRERFVSTFAGTMMAGFAGHAQDTRQEPNSGGAFAPSRADVEGWANETFSNLVGLGASCIDPARIQVELNELRSKAASLERFASTTIAHLVGKPTQPPTMPELDSCVRAFEVVVLRYIMLFRASAPTELLPTWQYDWKAVFREPWL